MKFIAITAAALVLAMGAAGAAEASPTSDAFGKCLVESSTGKDRIVIMQWLFSAISANPNVAAMSTVTPEQRVGYNQKGVEIMQRLVLVDCHAEAVAAIRADGDQAIADSFELLGRAAMGELMTDPSVARELNSLDRYSDAARWTALEAEAKQK